MTIERRRKAKWVVDKLCYSITFPSQTETIQFHFINGIAFVEKQNKISLLLYELIRNILLYTKIMVKSGCK